MRHLPHTIASVCALASLAGCAASASPQWDAAFGDRLRLLNAEQMIDPAAAASNGQVVKASDGRTVREAKERHVDSYKTPPAPTVINIGVGGAGR